MMAALWSDVDAEIASAVKHFDRGVKLFRSDRFAPGVVTDYYDEMAFLHAMQCGFTSFESALKRMFALLAEELPRGRDSHAALLQRAARPLTGLRPAVLDEALFNASDELRRFRHVAIHTYDFLDKDRAALTVKAAEVFLANIGPALARFRAVIDPD